MRCNTSPASRSKRRAGDTIDICAPAKRGSGRRAADTTAVSTSVGCAAATSAHATRSTAVFAAKAFVASSEKQDKAEETEMVESDTTDDARLAC